jgi:predicted regulator of Ras-like GTPase activity (Roadblock/LC7/MglB family)
MTVFSVLNEDTSRKIDQVLRELLEQVEAEAVFFCDRGGNIIASQSVSAWGNEETVAALAAGSFFATLTMAKLVGETEFQNILHQGDKTSIFMQGLEGDMEPRRLLDRTARGKSGSAAWPLAHGAAST